MIGQQILARKAHGYGKPFRALAHQHHVAGMLHDGFRNQRNILDVTHAADRARATRRSMHTAGIEFDDAFLVGQATEPDAGVVGIIFRPFHHAESRVQRVAAAGQEGVSVIEIVVAVVRANHDGTLAGRRVWFRTRGVLRVAPLFRQAQRQRTHYGSGKEIAARNGH